MKFNQETIATIGTSTGMAKLASATITDPISHFDLALPAGYDRFHLEFNNLVLSQSDYFGFLVSMDDGATFLADFTNFDTYQYNWFELNHNVPGIQTVVGNDAVGNIVQIGITHYDFAIEFWPGDTQTTFRILTQSVSFDNSGVSVGTNITILNSLATIPPTYGKVNLIRVQTQGNEDGNPPTGAATFTGSYILFGITA